MTPDFGVYLAPTPSGDPDALGAAAGLSRADAALALAARLPRRLLVERTVEDAKARAEALRAVGFDAFVVSRLALAQPPPARVKSFRLEGGTLFLDRLSFAPGELKLIVEGEIRRATEERETVRGSDDLGVLRERTDVTRRSDAEGVLHLYGDTFERAVEIRSRHFNFRGLGAAFGPAVGINQARFVATLQEHFPGAGHDDRLKRFPPFPDEGTFRHDGPGYDADVERKVRKDDNEAAVRTTSRLIAIHALRR
jgi:hypothetical protein